MIAPTGLLVVVGAAQPVEILQHGLLAERPVTDVVDLEQMGGAAVGDRALIAAGLEGGALMPAGLASQVSDADVASVGDDVGDVSVGDEGADGLQGHLADAGDGAHLLGGGVAAT